MSELSYSVHGICSECARKVDGLGVITDGRAYHVGCAETAEAQTERDLFQPDLDIEPVNCRAVLA